ncbi:MAG: DUF4339 domain-containing protein [Thermoleophilia bacterium]|nr:DUF4339 domain-containing protein [Thermoleophilia bacterium]
MADGLATGWHLSREGTTYGPYDWIDVVAWAREGRVGPDDLVWHEQLPGWTPARRVPGLIPPEAGGATQWGAPAPGAAIGGAAAGAGAAGITTPGARGAKRKRPWWFWALLTLAGLVIVAAVVLGSLYGAGVIWKSVPTVDTEMRGSTDIDVPFDSAKYPVPPEGGVIQVQGAEIAFPSGAVDTKTNVEMKVLRGLFNMTVDSSLASEPKGDAGVICSAGPRIHIGPTDLAFDKKVTITLPYKKSLLPEGATDDTMAMAYWNGATWVGVKAAVDTESDTVAVKVSEFTDAVWTPIYMDARNYESLKDGPLQINVSISPRDTDAFPPVDSGDSQTTGDSETTGETETTITEDDESASTDSTSGVTTTEWGGMDWGGIMDADLTGEWEGMLLQAADLEQSDLKIEFARGARGAWTVEFSGSGAGPVPVSYENGLIDFEHEGRVFQGALMDENTMSGWVKSSAGLDAPDGSWYVMRE